MGLFDFEQSSTTSTELPRYLERGSRYAVNQARDFYNDPIPRYRGERVADFTPQQTSSFDQIANWARIQPVVPGQALNMTRSAANAGPQKLTNYGRIVDQGGALGTIKSYMNPYTQNALDPAIRDIERAAAQERMRLGDRAAGANAYGDARQGVMEGAVDRNRVEARADTTYQAFADAYNNAMGLRQADLNRFTTRDLNQAGLNETALARRMSGAMQMQNIDTIAQQNRLRRMQAGLAVGNQQQQQQQNVLDVRYQDWERRRQEEYDRLAALVGAVNGVPYARTVTNTQPNNSLFNAAGSYFGSGGIPGMPII